MKIGNTELLHGENTRLMEAGRVLGTAGCHTGKGLGFWSHHGLGVTTSAAPEVGRWHLDVLGENYSSAENICFSLTRNDIYSLSAVSTVKGGS